MIQGNPPLYEENSLWEALSVVSQKWSFPTALVGSHFSGDILQKPRGKGLVFERTRVEKNGEPTPCSTSILDPYARESWFLLPLRITGRVWILPPPLTNPACPHDGHVVKTLLSASMLSASVLFQTFSLSSHGGAALADGAHENTGNIALALSAMPKHLKSGIRPQELDTQAKSFRGFSLRKRIFRGARC